MNDIKTRRLELLNDTINHFNRNNRAINSNGRCCYSHSVNGGCAIGRKLPVEMADCFDRDFPNQGMYNNILFKCLPTDLTDLGQNFLSQIQLLHDTDNNWNETGLNENGEEAVRIIKDNYGLNII